MGQMEYFLFLISWSLVLDRFPGHTKHIEAILIKNQILGINGFNMFSNKLHSQLLANVDDEFVLLKSFSDEIVFGLGFKSMCDEFLLLVFG